MTKIIGIFVKALSALLVIVLACMISLGWQNGFGFIVPGDWGGDAEFIRGALVLESSARLLIVLIAVLWIIYCLMWLSNLIDQAVNRGAKAHAG